MEQKLERYAPWGREEVSKALLKEWEALPQCTLYGLIDGFRDRLADCVEQGGGTISRAPVRECRLRCNEGRRRSGPQRRARRSAGEGEGGRIFRLPADGEALKRGAGGRPRQGKCSRGNDGWRQTAIL